MKPHSDIMLGDPLTRKWMRFRTTLNLKMLNRAKRICGGCDIKLDIKLDVREQRVWPIHTLAFQNTCPRVAHEPQTVCVKISYFSLITIQRKLCISIRHLPQFPIPNALMHSCTYASYTHNSIKAHPDTTPIRRTKTTLIQWFRRVCCPP